ncbi:MAG: 3-deoxy-8-phosphooctulonate synthase [Planctomycetota bacterium]|nr:3-deoxy-8-phosphooctulonate synthase [Planctomycetota bacterium]
MTQHRARIGNVEFGGEGLALIAGPCLAESRQLCLDVAGRLADLCKKLSIGLVFKASYDKANRSRGGTARGPGMDEGLAWLADVKKQFGLPVLSDVHETTQIPRAAAVLDCLQIPAFLCRQTDLLVAAAGTGKCVNIKKGQFMAPWDMAGAVEKVRQAGNDNVLLTERGTSFGYNRLVTDFRGIPQMRAFAPVVFHATHSVQEPAALGACSGGQREFVSLLACAAMTAGADALFLETHPDPAHALSDAATQLPLAEMEAVLKRCLAVRKVCRE